MSIDIQKLYKIVDEHNVLTDIDVLNDRYCKPIIDGTSNTPIVAILPKNTWQSLGFRATGTSRELA